MGHAAPKRLSELPVFRVDDVRDEGDRVELHGYFETVLTSMENGSGHLLNETPESLDAVSVQLAHPPTDDGEATFIASPEASDWPVGQSRFLEGNAEPVHVWMISIPTWKWVRTYFRPSDAVATRRPAEAFPAPPSGQRVEFWLELACANSPEKSRLYPNRDSPEGVVAGGWDHEHCEFCDTHIEAGQVGFVDPGHHWLCEACFQQYLRPT